MKHARCIELGSGTGCLGISVATALWCPREWIFSDIGDTLVECLRNARENDVVGGSDFENGDGRTKLNVHRSNHYGHESRKRGGQSTKGGNRTQRKSEPHHLKVQFVELDWTDAHAIRNLSTSLFPSSDTDGAARIDFAFATDCVYHESLVGPFVARLKEIHEMSNKRRSENESFVRPTVGYLAQELRSSIVLLELVKQLLEAGFTVYRREASNSSEEGRSGMVLYAIMVES
ncbi:hypothetical protein BJ742DRAFT_796304 [Cladochytrium replicatum]|nr:hypothetical protein BJ742DRAFT_796304 [Cladochytrium replicatum]